MTPNDDVFRALADSTRRLILKELMDNDEQTLYELCVRLTMEHDIDMSRQGVSKHLDVLEEAGLIASTRRGKYKILSSRATAISRRSQPGWTVWPRTIPTQKSRGSNKWKLP